MPPTPGFFVNRRSLALIALNVAIGLVIVGATTAYGVMSSTVVLTVDGKTEKVRTFSDTVSEVLDERGVDVQSDDRLNVDPAAAVTDDLEIVVEYAKDVTLAVDGEVSEHTVYDATAEEAFETLEVDVPDDAFVAHEPSDVLERDGETLVVSSTKDLTVEADGETYDVTTNKPQVADVLEEAGVTLDADDEVEPGVDSFVKPDAELEVIRIEKVDKTETVPVEFDVEVEEDPSAFEGETVIVSAGVEGEKVEEVTLVKANGKVRDRIVHSSTVTKEAVAQVERRGTKTTPPDSVWDRLARCESGGNWSISTGNGYYGGVQFSASTWRAVGGSGLPHQHSREEQIKRAKILQSRAGWGQWPGCARKLGLL